MPLGTGGGGGGGEAAAPAPTAEEYKEQGNAEYRNGRFLKAAALYTQALKLDPANAVLYRCARGGTGPRQHSAEAALNEEF